MGWDVDSGGCGAYVGTWDIWKLDFPLNFAVNLHLL